VVDLGRVAMAAPRAVWAGEVGEVLLREHPPVPSGSTWAASQWPPGSMRGEAHG
jgi:hypothetical protein